MSSRLIVGGSDTSPPALSSQRHATSLHHQSVAGDYWLGKGEYWLPAPTRDGAQLQYNPPPGYKITHDPATRQLLVTPGKHTGHQAAPSHAR